MTRRPAVLIFTLAALVLAGLLGGCSSTRLSFAEYDALRADTRVTEDRFRREDPSLHRLIDRASGYAIFPGVGSAKFIVGGAYGEGLVYERVGAGGEPDAFEPIGFSVIKQLSLGLQAGAEGLSQMIIFENQNSLDRFTRGNFEFGANASATALTAGAARDAAFSNGLAVFTMTNGGLAAGVNIGGQNFSYQDLDRVLPSAN